MDKKKGNVKKAFSTRQFKMGAYQTAITAIVIVVIVFINLVVTKANITVDLSSDQKYTLTEDTRTLPKGLKDDVKIYYMCQDDQEVEMIKKVLDQYNGLGSVKVVTKDPVQYPQFASQYTEDEIASNDVIVVNESDGKSKHVSMEDMVPPTMDYSTYQQSYDTLDVEGQVTAALQAVTSADSKKLYYSKGHGEQELGTSFSDLMSKSNIEISDTRLDEKNGMPEDCDFLMIHGPVYDLSDTEYKAVKTYLENGGKAVFTLNAAASDKDLNNYYKLLNDYGISVADGMVLEDSEHSYNRSPNAVKASLAEHDITASAQDKETIMANVKGLQIAEDVRSTLKISQILTSSENSFSRVSPTETSTQKVEGDIDGPFNLAVAVEDTYRENTTRLAVFGSYYVSNDSFAESNQFGNRSIMLNTMSWLAGQETTTLAIPTRSLAEPTVEVGDSDRVFWISTLVIILPLAILGFGFFIWYRRRKS